MRPKVFLAVAAAFAVVLLLYLCSGSRTTQRGEQGGAAKTSPAAPTASHLGRTTPASSPNAVVTIQNSLLPSASLTWQKADDAPEFASFAEWANRFRNAATPEEKTALAPEGVALAQARRDALADLIQSDP